MDVFVILMILCTIVFAIRKAEKASPTRRLLAERIEQAKKKQRADTPLHDPIQDDDLYSGIWRKANAEVDEMLKDEKKGRGFCRKRWRVLKEHLKGKYGVEWFSPGEMNPGWRFD